MCFCVSLCLGTDDEPYDGPQHYILMSGLYQPHLIVALDAIGVHVANVIKFYSEHRQTCELQQEQHTSESNKPSQRTSPVDGKLPSLLFFVFCIIVTLRSSGTLTFL